MSALYMAYKVGNVYFIPKVIKAAIQPLLDDLRDFIKVYPYARFEFQADDVDINTAEFMTCDVYLYSTPRSYNPVVLSDVRKQRPLISVLDIISGLLDTGVGTDILLLLLSDFSEDDNIYVVGNKAVLPTIDAKPASTKGYMLVELLGGHLEGLTSLKLPDVTASLNYSFDNLVYVDEAGFVNGRQYQSHTDYDELLHLSTKEIILEYDNQGVAVVKQYVVDNKYESGSDEKVVHTTITDYQTGQTSSVWSTQKVR